MSVDSSNTLYSSELSFNNRLLILLVDLFTALRWDVEVRLIDLISRCCRTGSHDDSTGIRPGESGRLKCRDGGSEVGEECSKAREELHGAKAFLSVGGIVVGAGVWLVRGM